MFGLDLARRELARVLELPKHKRTRRTSKQLSDDIERNIFHCAWQCCARLRAPFQPCLGRVRRLSLRSYLVHLTPVEEWYAPDKFFLAAAPPEAVDLKVRVGSAIADARYPLTVAVRTAFRHTFGPWTADEIESSIR